MKKLLRICLFGLFLVASLPLLAAIQEPDEILVSSRKITELCRGREDLEENPIKINVLFARADVRFELIHGFYTKHNSAPITMREIANECRLTKTCLARDLLPEILVEEPKIIFFVMEAHFPGEEQPFADRFFLDEGQLYKYGFLKHD